MSSWTSKTRCKIWKSHSTKRWLLNLLKSFQLLEEQLETSETALNRLEQVCQQKEEKNTARLKVNVTKVMVKSWFMVRIVSKSWLMLTQTNFLLDTAPRKYRSEHSIFYRIVSAHTIWFFIADKKSDLYYDFLSECHLGQTALFLMELLCCYNGRRGPIVGFCHSNLFCVYVCAVH